MRNVARIALLVAIGGAAVAGCGGAKHTAHEPSRGGSINVAIVDTPNSEDLARLTPSLFTSDSHITVNYTKLDEGTLRDVVTSDLTDRAGTIGYELLSRLGQRVYRVYEGAGA